MDLKNILPEDGPPLSEVNKYIKKYKNDLIVIKYGGNVLIDRNVFNNFIIDLFVITPVSIADSGQRSLISKTYGAFFILDKIYPEIPINNGGDAAVLYCFIFLFIAAMGSGIWSIDNKKG